MKKLLILGFLIIGFMAGQIINAGPEFDKALTKETPVINKEAIINEVKGTIDKDKIAKDTLEIVKPKGTFEFKSTYKKRLESLIDFMYNDELERLVEKTYKERLAKVEDYVGRLQIMAIWFMIEFNFYNAQINMRLFQDDKQFGIRFHSFLDPLAALRTMIKEAMELKYPIALKAIEEVSKELGEFSFNVEKLRKRYNELKNYYAKLYEKIKPLEETEKIWADDPKFISLD